MFIERILIKKEKESDWEIGYQLGKSRYENVKIFDKDMNIVSDEEGRVWDITSVLDEATLVMSVNDDSQDSKNLEAFANKNYIK